MTESVRLRLIDKVLVALVVRVGDSESDGEVDRAADAENVTLLVTDGDSDDVQLAKVDDETVTVLDSLTVMLPLLVALADSDVLPVEVSD